MIGKLQMWAAIAGAFVVTLAIVAWKFMSIGAALTEAKAAAKERKDVQTITNQRTKVDGMSPADRDKEFDSWTKPGQ